MTTINTKKAIIDNNPPTAIVGIRVILPFTADSKEQIIHYFQTKYFDEIGSDGYFRLIPQSNVKPASLEYLQGDIGDIELDDAWGVERLSKVSYVDILLGNTAMERGALEELEAIQSELNELVAQNYALGWSQFNITV
jgi:hypothetical protein